LMNDNIEDLIELRLWSLEKIKENKAKVAHAYNKKVKLKEFQVGDLVWEAVLPLGTKDAAYGKWSPNWLIELTKSCPKMHICLRSWTVSSSQWLSMISISRSIFTACGMADIEQPMICIRLYREGGRYVESANNKKRKKKRKGKENTQKEREKEKEKTHVQ
jgi:hypothetical protein